jgi:hypothetical protein
MDDFCPPAPKEPKGRRKRRGSEKRQMQYRTTERWNGDDYARLQAAAEREGLTIGGYIRSRALANPTTGTRRRASVELLALTKTLAQVSRVGGNLHQLVRHLNFGGLADLDEVRSALRGFDEMVFALMDAIGRERG